ncbi:hypothetical protein [Streptomyces nigra]|uniref:Uncharacterized protein n=1 Tax=Streptomyces nigra TaxID=1827580 RepID=A0ABZ1ISE9_9ACTN
MYTVVALVPLLLEGGYTTHPATRALGISDAGQNPTATVRRPRPPHHRHGPHNVALGAQPTATFAAVPGPCILLIFVSVMVGMVRGNLTLLQATAITDPRGAMHYGRLSGLLAAPATTASAHAPFVGAALAAPPRRYGPLFFWPSSRWLPRLSAPWTATDAADPDDSPAVVDHN